MNRITTYLNSLGRATRATLLGLAVIFGSAGIAQAASTISTNISTGGTLAVTGASTLTGNVTAAGTLAVTGASTLTGNVAAAGTLDVTGATTLAITTSASTTATSFKVGQTGTQMTAVVTGYCSFTDVTLAASSTSGFAACTTVPAGVLVAGDRVFVQATSSFEAPFIITAASTTGVSTIQLRILNTGLGTADGTLSGTSINFWAVR